MNVIPMNDKERLVKVLNKKLRWESSSAIECFADYLLANGIIVLPCPVGTTVFAVEREYCDRREFDKCDEYCDGWNACCERNNASWCVAEHVFRISMMDRIGKSVFLTREEADEYIKSNK